MLVVGSANQDFVPTAAHRPEPCETVNKHSAAGAR
jgi:hypothetical protein